MNNCVLLFSGGIDSFVAYHYLNKPKTVYFNLNTPYSKKEMRVIEELIPSTIIEKNTMDLSTRQSGEKAYIPFRNLYLASLACHYSDRIVIAGIKGDNVSDKNKKIFKEFSLLLSKLEGRQITVFSPFWGMSKVDIIKWYLKNNGSEKQLLKTVSCYSKQDRNYCGCCPSCFRKWVALWRCGIKLEWKNEALLNQYEVSAKNNVYDKERNDDIIKVIHDYRSRH